MLGLRQPGAGRLAVKLDRLDLAAGGDVRLDTVEQVLQRRCFGHIVFSGHWQSLSRTQSGQRGLRATQVSRPCRIMALPKAVCLSAGTTATSAISISSAS